MITSYDALGDVTVVRRFPSINTILGVRKEADSWFVVMGGMRDTPSWRTHCGPYSTPEQAAEWINAIRESGAQ